MLRVDGVIRFVQFAILFFSGINVMILQSIFLGHQYFLMVFFQESYAFISRKQVVKQEIQTGKMGGLKFYTIFKGCIS